MKYLFRVREQDKSQEIKKCLEFDRSKMSKLQDPPLKRGVG